MKRQTTVGKPKSSDMPSANPGGGYTSSKKKIKPDKRAFQHAFPKFKLAN